MSNLVVRTFLPGSEWLYVRLYASPASVDRILIRYLSPVIEEKLAHSSSWFFLRYGDPDSHIRLRFRGSTSFLYGDLLQSITARASEAQRMKLLWKMELGTYIREMERYGGGSCIELAERIFHADSMCVLQLLRALEHSSDANARWHLTVLGVHKLFDDFGINYENRLEIMDKLSRGFEKEFDVGSSFRKSLSQKYRIESQSLEKLIFNGDPQGGSDQVSFNAPFAARSHTIEHTALELLKVLRGEGRERKYEDILVSIIHMHVNRMLRSSQRAQELIIYNFMQRLYRGVLNADTQQARSLRGRANRDAGRVINL